MPDINIVDPSSAEGSTGTATRLPLDWNAVEDMLTNNHSEQMFNALNDRFMDAFEQGLASDPTRQEEYKSWKEEEQEVEAERGGSLTFFSEALAWSFISNGKTAKDLVEPQGEWLEEVFDTPEEFTKGLQSCRTLMKSYIDQGKVSVPPELIIDYRSITDDEALHATRDKTQAAVEHALKSRLQWARPTAADDDGGEPASQRSVVTVADTTQAAVDEVEGGVASLSVGAVDESRDGDNRE
ncbi:hypothetical protein L198_02577 [Cryptococcus wingfieldii CBS 7118]|uniref:Uncharacterized protein n=1 Tax=Cryptococcus wingfieldii CBS 7118 TaxID=1295528 RepID=A0A1E3JLW5_9TREE|nr:hypothetical protein L198_02577 [Cryptococcus wingfieldii CBS 7118]ODO01850.1 hypothetical protein L198_02577 [Cryptococcus wingfieldii CBS 7118]